MEAMFTTFFLSVRYKYLKYKKVSKHQNFKENLTMFLNEFLISFKQALLIWQAVLNQIVFS